MAMINMQTIDELTRNFPRAGRVEWIGLRPERRAPVCAVRQAEIHTGGLAGDHRNKAGPRAVTLIQHEHLAAIAALAGLAEIDPGKLRRNIVVSGINLSALKGRTFQVGDAVLEGTENCVPCSRMEEALGPGGYNIMRGHGGLCAAVIKEGRIEAGSQVIAL